MPPVVLGAITAVSAVASVAQQRKASKASKKARAESQRQQELAARRERTQTLRSAQIARAQAVASAAGVGALESSGAAGGIGSVSSRAGEALGFGTQLSGISRNISYYQQQEADAISRANLFGAASGLTGKLGGNAYLRSRIAPTTVGVPFLGPRSSGGGGK